MAWKSRTPKTPLPTGNPIFEAVENGHRMRSKSGKIAWVLDELIRIPGTRFRFGLDPLLGLIPGGGETVATLIGTLLLADAGKRGIPFRTIFKMSGNLLLNASIGAIPFIGDAFSLWFKSNSRNYRLLRQWTDSHGSSQVRGGWWPLLLILLIIAIVLFVNLASWFLILWAVHWLFNQALPVAPK
jgi:hypothetical protein